MNSTPSPIQLTPLTDMGLRVRFTGAQISLPPRVQDMIDAHWQTMTAKRPNLFNGPVYSVTNIEQTPHAMIVDMAESTFAHYAHSEIHDAGEHAFHVLHSAALVITNDHKIVLGEMAHQTSRSGAVCFSGGAIDPEDIHDGIVDLAGNTQRELYEELGIDTANQAQVTAFAPAYLKTGGPRGKITAVYRIDLAVSGEELQNQYDEYISHLPADEPAEFSRLYFVDSTPEGIEAFIGQRQTQLDEYVVPVLRALMPDV